MITDKQSHLVVNLILLTLVVFFVQMSFVIADIFSYLSGVSFSSEPLLRDIFSFPTVLIALSELIVYQILLYIIYAASIWYLSVSLGAFLRLKTSFLDALGLLLWSLSLVLIVDANLYFFPKSFFSNLLSHDLFEHTFSVMQLRKILMALTGFFIVVSALAVIEMMIGLLSSQYRRRYLFLSGFIVLILGLSAANYGYTASRVWSGATDAKPNIILIGLDALRPDFINPVNTPHLAAFMQSSVNFTHAYTPIAQTFPSWISVLTAMGPKFNNARENLADLSHIYHAETLPIRLQQAGYETIYATDDARFNNVDKRFGFDRIVTPKAGVSEFIIGSFNDSLLSNLVLLSGIVPGQKLFPYNYGNHESIATYEPSSFLALVKESLHQNEAKPLFLALHLNLAGWPFGWARSTHDESDLWFYRYSENIPTLDQQFAEFMQILANYHLLENAIVIVLSDHGITLGLSGERMVSQSFYQGNKKQMNKMESTDSITIPERHQKQSGMMMDVSYGYGGDLLGLKQNQIVLAFHRYDKTWAPTSQAEPVSLLDIAPTLLDILGLPSLSPCEGLSLKSQLGSTKNRLPATNERAFYFETSGESNIGTALEPSTRQFMSLNMNDYYMDKNAGMIFIKPDAVKRTSVNKQRGILQGEWLLVDIPGKRMRRTVVKRKPSFSVTRSYFREPPYSVLLNMKTGKWTIDLNSSWAHKAPLKVMCKAFKDYYNHELLCSDCSLREEKS